MQSAMSSVLHAAAQPATQQPFPLAVMLCYPTSLPGLGLRRKPAKAGEQPAVAPLKPQATQG